MGTDYELKLNSPDLSPPSRMLWSLTDKGDQRCRRLADRHYTRQSVGHPMWTRPGYNWTLYYEDTTGAAVFNWWRPKWEDDVQRQDGLKAIECTIFRNETSVLSSDLIRQATAAVLCWSRCSGYTDGLITAVQSKKTSGRRSKRSLPGECFRRAGWSPFEHGGGGKPDVWLKCVEYPLPLMPLMEPRGQLGFGSHVGWDRH